MRGKAVRFVLAFLMGFLLAPQSGALPSDAHAHVPEILAHSLAEAGAGEPHGQYGTCGTPDRGGEPNGVLRHRDRHRSATVAAPDAPSRSAVTSDAREMLAPAAVAATGDAQRTSRSWAAHSAPALQVFRC